MTNKNKIKDADGIHSETAHNCSEAEIRYAAVFDQSPDGILIVDAEGKIIDFNKAAHSDLGYTREEFAKLSISDIDPLESPEEIRANIQRAMIEKKAEFEVIHRNKSGQLRNVHVITQAISLSGHTVMHTIWRDITDQKAADNKIRYLASILEHVPDAVCSIDMEGKIVAWNEGAERILGYKADEIIGKPIQSIIPEEKVREEMEHCINELNKRGVFGGYESLRIAKDGMRVPVEISGLALRDGQKITGYASIMRDVTLRKRAELELMESRKFLETVIESAPTCIKLITADGTLQHMNRVGLNMIEADSLDQVKGHCIYPMVSEEHREAFRHITQEVFKGEFQTLEFRMIGLKGRPLWLYTYAVPLRDEKGEISFALATTIDITDRKEAEEKIRQSEEFIRNILDTVDEGFIVIDRDFRILTANKAYCSQVGESCDTVIGRHCYETSHKTLRPCFEEGEECAVRHVFETGEPHTSLHKHPDSKSSILYVETKAFPIRDSTGAVTSVIETVNNITEKHLLEEEQLKTQKLEAIGTLAGGIAHDFNNLLQGIFGYISMAKITLDQPERALEMLEQAEKALHMSVNLTSQLLTFSKGGNPLKKKIPLQSVIENSVKFALSGSRVDYRIKLDEDLWAIDADEGQIGQVIQNLVLNAEQAMPLGGTINISVRNVSSRQKGIAPALQKGNYVEISIKDSGIGIPEQYLPKIFDPYFTTKDKGSGLGLATSYSIIKNHGGLIDVKSKLGKGTTFFVYLPAVETLDTLAVTVSRDVQTVRKARILLMDDEDLVRNIAGVMIRSLGHEVELAENGEEAIGKYRESMRSGRPFDIAIMDLTIRGGMGGEEAIKGLLEIDPDVKAIVSSGYADSSAMSEFKTIGFRTCLTKPYDIDSLNAALNSLLD